MIVVIKHISNEGSGYLGDYFKEQHIPLNIIELSSGDHLPALTDSIDGVISMGGPMNVYQEAIHPFLRDEAVFIRDVVKKEIPFLGICLGAQMLAKALGARVRRASRMELGWHQVPLTTHGVIDPLFEYTDSVLDVFQWHEDRFELPYYGTLLGENEVCPQAFKVGTAYGLQFHVEATPQMIEAWLSSPSY